MATTKKKNPRSAQRKTNVRDLKPKRDAKGGVIRNTNNVNLDAQKKEIEDV